VLDDLRALLGTRDEPTFKAVQVWPKAIPQYVLGYGRFKDIADQIERGNPGLMLAGTYRDGVSLGDAIGSGQRAASRAARLLGVEEVAMDVERG
jgi:oxygen-dependent protoporphyrinogen oxidase